MSNGKDERSASYDDFDQKRHFDLIFKLSVAAFPIGVETWNLVCLQQTHTDKGMSYSYSNTHKC